jgi:copper homeostasis protein
MENILEIACFDYESALIAAKAGANRIEYCHDYSMGGKSPDYASTKRLIEQVNIPVFVMLRIGEGFHFDLTDLDIYKNQIIEFKKIGVHGFVIGFLDKNNEIDEIFNGSLLELIKPLPCTFHRAIDHTSNYFKSIEKVINMGFNRILTSGGKGNACDFIQNLSTAQINYRNKIAILPGGGIRHTNIKDLKEKTKCNEFHSAAFINNKINVEEIKKLLDAIRS